MMLLDLVIYLFLGWYCSKVVPRTYGRTQPKLFLFKKSYWFPEKLSIDSEIRDGKHRANSIFNPLLLNDQNYEEYNDEEIQTVSIRVRYRLKKISA